MATKFVLKRKTFDDSDKKSRTGRNIALGLGTAAATGLAFAGARRGFMGGRAQMATNRVWNKAGKALGSTGMQASAQKGYVAGYLEHNNLEANVKNLKKASDAARSKGLTSRKARDTGGYKGTKYENRTPKKEYMTDKQIAQQEEAARQKRAADYAKSQERAKAQQKSGNSTQQQQAQQKPISSDSNISSAQKLDNEIAQRTAEGKKNAADIKSWMSSAEGQKAAAERSVMANRRQPAYSYTPSKPMPAGDSIGPAWNDTIGSMARQHVK